MRLRHKLPNVFGLYMVDVLCCSLGCVILLWLFNDYKSTLLNRDLEARGVELARLTEEQRARAAETKTSGATSGNTVAEYLRGTMPAASSEKVLERLMESDPMVPTQVSPVESKPNVNEATLAALNQPLPVPAPAKPIPTAPLPPYDAKVNEKLNGLLGDNSSK